MKSHCTLPPRATTLLCVLALGTVALASCNGSSFPGSPATALPATGSDGRAKPSPTPFDLKFTTLDDPNSTTFNRALGINQLGTVVGYYGSGSPSDPSHGYQIQAPYTKFKHLDYPGAMNTVATSLSSNHLRAGWFTDASKGHHTWGFVKDSGVWSLYKDSKEPNGAGDCTELLGINGSDIAVGYYMDGNGNDMPVELVVNTGRFQPLRPPGAVSAQAAGINLRGDVVGTETLASGQTEGWLLRNGAYTQFAYPGAATTSGLGIDFQDQVIGSYTDYSGGTHGYILLHPTDPSSRFWQSIDEPDAAGVTVLNGLNSKGQFVGWYVDAQGYDHGFLAQVRDSGRPHTRTP